MKTVEEQLKIIMKGVDEIIGVEQLEEKLKDAQLNNKKLIIKFGLDPSAPDIHLGHTVVLRKLKQMQDLGHRAVIIIGDFTGMIGDPTGKSKGRKALTREEVIENAITYENQIFKVLDKDKTEVKFNSEWLAELKLEEVIKLASTMTVARMLEREEFKKRFENNIPISIHEFLYPIMQGVDSVEIKADVELGGTDQRFNVLMGRMLQKHFGQEPQATIFMPLLEGTDGKEKMSKSLGNYIGIDESAEVIFEKTMTIPDELIIKYFELVTDIHPDEIEKIKERLKSGDNPRDLKMILAKEVTKLYHGEESSNLAEERFKTVFQKKEIPTEMKTFEVDANSFDLATFLVNEGIVKSKAEVRRLAAQNGIKINETKVLDLAQISKEEEMVVQIGKKTFIKIIIRSEMNGR